TTGLLVGGGGSFGTPTVSVIPYATGSDASTRPVPSTVTATTFVGYDATNSSVRALQAADYSTFAAATSTANVSDGGFTVSAGGATVNSLRLTGDATLSGNLTLTAGALMNIAAATVSGPGTLTTANSLYVTATAPLTITAPVQAANLIKSG